MICSEPAYFVRVIKQFWMHAVTVKHCSRYSCSVKCLNLWEVCLMSSSIVVTVYQILSESRMNREIRNAVRILAVLLVELTDLQSTGTHYKSWLQHLLPTLFCCTPFFFWSEWISINCSCSDFFETWSVSLQMRLVSSPLMFEDSACALLHVTIV
jgi:hypothetical protein